MNVETSEGVGRLTPAVIRRAGFAAGLAAILGLSGIARAASPPLAVIPTIELPHHATALHASVGGREGVFLFDTGGGVTVVTPSVAAAAGCHPWGQMSGFRATGERLDLPRCDDLHLVLGGHDLTAPIAGTLDINRMMGPGTMPTLSGLIALDLFAGRIVTIRPVAHELVLETQASLRDRVQGAAEVPIRMVRDLEGVALSVDAAVPTSAGRAWMELDIGNLSQVMVGRHVAALLGLDAARTSSQDARFGLVGGVPVQAPARVSDLVMDGDIGESVLQAWDVTLDLAAGRAWFRHAGGDRTQAG